MASSNTLPVRLLCALTCLAALTAASSASAANGYDELGSGWCRTNGQPGSLLLTDQAVLAWQGDGNLVLYDRALCGATCGPVAALWSTGTGGGIGRKLCFADDGEMTVYNANNVPVFASGTGGYAFKDSRYGRYISAPYGGGATLNLNAQANGPNERFDLIEEGETRLMAIRAANGVNYMNLDGHANSASVGQRERFFIQDNNDGTVSIRSADYIVSAAPDQNNDTVYVGEAGDVVVIDSGIPGWGGGHQQNQLREPDYAYLFAQNGAVQFGTMTDIILRSGNTGIPPATHRFYMTRVDKLTLEGRALSLANVDGALWTVGVAVPADTGIKQQFGKDDQFGNRNFGAGYEFGIGFQQRFEGHARAFAGGAVFGKIFGRRLNIIAASAEAVSLNNQHQHDASFEALGIEIPIALLESERELFTPLERTFFTASTTFMVGPIPLYVSGSVTGTAGMTGSYGIGGSGLSVTITPYLDVTVTAEAGIGVRILGCTLGGGVQASLSLINVSVPLTMAIDFLLEEAALTGELVVTSLSGSVSLVGRLCSISRSWELGSWAPAAAVTFGLVDKVFSWSGDEVVPTTIRNYWRNTDYINVSGGTLGSSAVGANAPGAEWRIEPVAGTSYVRIKNANGYIHAENHALEVGPIHAGAWSAMWTLETVSGNTKRIRNRWTGKYLHTEQGGLNYGPVGAGWNSAYWVFE